MADSFALNSTGGVVLTDSTSGHSAQSASAGDLTQARGGTTSTTMTNTGSSEGWAGAAAQLLSQQKTIGADVLDAISKVSGGMLDQMIAQRQQKAYFNGMAQVAQGQALDDIKNEQPWYTQIFGPNATVRGAQAMTVSQKIQDAQTQFLQNMPELKKMTPDDVRRFLVDQASQINVGDEGVNNIIQAKLAEGWKPMLEAHTKQHYAYVQEQNSRAYSGLQVSQGAYLQSIANAGAGDFLSTETGQRAVKQTLDQIDTNPGMDDEAWRKSSIAAVRTNYEQGNFIYGRIFRSSKQWQTMSADEQRQLDEAQQKYEQRFLGRLSYSGYGTQKADIISQANLGLISRNDAIKAAHSLNAQVSQATGVESPFFTGQDLEGIIKGNNRAIVREMDRADRQREKADDAHQKELQKLADVNFTVTQINAGDPEQAIVTGAASKAEVEQLMNSRFSELAQQDPNAAVQYVAKTNARSAFVSDRIATMMTAGMRSSLGKGYTDAFAVSADWYNQLRKVSPAAADAYFGHHAPQMHNFVDMVSAGAQPADAWKSTFAEAPRMNNIMNLTGGRQQAQDAIQKAVGSAWQDGGVMAALGFRQTTAPYLMRNLSTAVTNRMDQYVGANMDINQAALVATKNAGVDQFGRDGYIKAPGQMSIARTLNIPDDAIGDVFAGIRDAKLAAIGANASQINGITRSGDNLYVSLVTDDGITHFVPVSADEMKSAYRTNTKFRDNTKRPMSPNSNLLDPTGAAFIGM